jgi:hypothetical protein
MAGALSTSQFAITQQAIANVDSSASAWLTASPAWPDNQMNDRCFGTAFQMRNLLPVSTGNWCKCGKEMDSLTSHMYVCSDKSSRNKIRNTMHRKVCESLKKIDSFNPFNSERHCNLFGSIISVVFIYQMIKHVLAVIVLEVLDDPCIQRLGTSGSILGKED